MDIDYRKEYINLLERITYLRDKIGSTLEPVADLELSKAAQGQAFVLDIINGFVLQENRPKISVYIGSLNSKADIDKHVMQCKEATKSAIECNRVMRELADNLVAGIEQGLKLSLDPDARIKDMHAQAERIISGGVK